MAGLRKIHLAGGTPIRNSLGRQRLRTVSHECATPCRVLHLVVEQSIRTRAILRAIKVGRERAVVETHPLTAQLTRAQPAVHRRRPAPVGPWYKLKRGDWPARMRI